MIDWATISNIATMVSAVLGAGSLLAGFAIYYISKRDTYVDKFRSTVAGVRSRMERLNNLINFELAHELTSIVINSEEVKYVVDKCHRDYFSNPTATKEQLQAYLDENFPLLSTSFHTDLVHQYGLLISEIESDISPYQTSFPGYCRVVDPALHIFKAILGNNKRVVREEDVWKKLLIAIFEKEKSKAESPQFLRARLMALFVGLLEEKRKRHDEDDISDLIEIIVIVSDGYLAKSEHQLMAQRNRERSEKLRPASEVELATDDIKEAEKCIKHLISQEKLLHIRELGTKIHQRNSAKDG